MERSVECTDQNDEYGFAGKQGNTGLRCDRPGFVCSRSGNLRRFFWVCSDTRFPWWSDLFHRVVGVVPAYSIDSGSLRGELVFALFVGNDDAIWDLAVSISGAIDVPMVFQSCESGVDS